MESRLTSGGMRFQADNFTKLPSTSMDIAMEKVGFLFFFPVRYSITKARTPKSPCDIFFRVGGTPGFCLFCTIFRGRGEAFGKLAMKNGNNVKDWPVGCVFLLFSFFVFACSCLNLVEQFERVKCEIGSGKKFFFSCSIDFSNSFLFRWGFLPGSRFLRYS